MLLIAVKEWWRRNDFEYTVYKIYHNILSLTVAAYFNVVLHSALLKHQRSYAHGKKKTDSIYIENSLIEDQGKDFLIYDYMVNNIGSSAGSFNYVQLKHMRVPECT